MPERPKAVVVVAAFLFFATVLAFFVGGSLLFPNPLMYRLWALNRPGETLFVSVRGPASVFLISAGDCDVCGGIWIVARAGLGLVVRGGVGWGGCVRRCGLVLCDVGDLENSGGGGGVGVGDVADASN